MIIVALQAISHENFLREVCFTFETRSDGDEDLLPVIDAALSEEAFPKLRSIVLSICIPCEGTKEIVRTASSTFVATRERVDVRIEYLSRRAKDTLPPGVLFSALD